MGHSSVTPHLARNRHNRERVTGGPWEEEEEGLIPRGQLQRGACVYPGARPGPSPPATPVC
jgi:hypothetical protein